MGRVRKEGKSKKRWEGETKGSTTKLCTNLQHLFESSRYAHGLTEFLLSQLSLNITVVFNV